MGRLTCHSNIGLPFLTLTEGPASVLTANDVCFCTCLLEHWTCHWGMGLVILKPGFACRDIGLVTLDLGLHSEWQITIVSRLGYCAIGLAILLPDLRPSFILNNTIMIAPTHG